MRRIRSALTSPLLAALLVAAAPAAMAHAEDMVLNDFSSGDGPVRFSAPKIEVTGTNLTRSEVEKILKGDFNDASFSRIGALNATRIAVPEFTIEQRLKGDPNPIARRTYVFKDLSLGNIKNGLAATTAVASARFTSNGEEVNLGAMRLTDLDIGFLLKLVAERAGSDNTAKALLGEGTLESLAYSKPGSGINISAIAVKGLRFQPGETRMLGLTGRLTTGAWRATVAASGSDPATEWALKGFFLQADAVKDGIPSQFSAKADGLAFDKGLLAKRGFSDLGYDQLVASAEIEGGYDAKKQELTIRTAAVSIDNFGSMTLSALIGRITPDILLQGKTLASTPATVKSMTLKVVNGGLYDRIVAREAKKTGKSLDDTRTRLSAQGRAVVAMMMGAYPANPLIEALIRFAGAPGTLDVSSTAIDTNGFPVADFGKKDDKGPLISRAFTVKASAR